MTGNPIDTIDVKRRKRLSNTLRQVLRGLDDQIIFPQRKFLCAFTPDLHGIFDGKSDDGFIPKIQCQPRVSRTRVRGWQMWREL